MYMKDWIQKLDEFLALSGKDPPDSRRDNLCGNREAEGILRIRQIPETDTVRALTRGDPLYREF